VVQLNAIDLKPHSIEERELLIKNNFDASKHVGILLQTCNRVELYYGEGKIDDNIARHLFRVVSGLESGFMGETAIQHQVKDAYKKAAECNKLNKSLHRLFQTALMVGKRVRTETQISQGALSHSQAAAQLVLQKYNSLCNTNITLIGINNINETIIRYLVRKGANAILVGNRTFSKAQALAQKYNGQAFDFSQISDVLERTDILISATSAPHTVIKFDKFPPNKSMLVIDLAVPRDIDADIAYLPNVELFNLEQIEKLTLQNLDNRRGSLLKAEEIIEEEVVSFVIRNS
jgi:glutamyl-tRNA reductase